MLKEASSVKRSSMRFVQILSSTLGRNRNYQCHYAPRPLLLICARKTATASLCAPSSRLAMPSQWIAKSQSTAEFGRLRRLSGRIGPRSPRHSARLR
jgi:hypothetical protein